MPRSFIAELLVDGSFDDWLGSHTHNILDLCTGNGSLAVIAAMAYPETTVVGADISTDALAVARINVDKHGLQDRIRLVESDSWHGLKDEENQALFRPQSCATRPTSTAPAWPPCPLNT